MSTLILMNFNCGPLLLIRIVENIDQLLLRCRERLRTIITILLVLIHVIFDTIGCKCTIALWCKTKCLFHFNMLQCKI